MSDLEKTISFVKSWQVDLMSKLKHEFAKLTRNYMTLNLKATYLISSCLSVRLLQVLCWDNLGT